MTISTVPTATQAVLCMLLALVGQLCICVHESEYITCIHIHIHVWSHAHSLLVMKTNEVVLLIVSGDTKNLLYTQTLGQLFCLCASYATFVNFLRVDCYVV